MKRKYFDRNLFVEGLSQIKMAGTILFIISFLGSLLVPFSRWFKIIEYQRQGISVTNLLRPVRITEIAPIIIPFIYVAPFIFCFILFAFLNKRNSSDFYHSLSCRRITIFNSFTASAMLWIAATVIICVSTSGIVYQLLGIHVYFSYIIWLIGTFIAGALLVFSCMLLAMSATGTTFTNIVLFGLIFFLPRFIFLMFGKALTSAVNILIIKDTNIVNYSNNIPIKFIFRFILNDNSTNSNQLYSSLSAIVYTLIIAVIYFCLAGIIFNKRKSEAAGSSAPNSILQHVYRCVVTLPVAIIIPILALNENSGKVISIIICSMIAVFVYYLYELLTTRSLKKVINATPILLIVAVACVVFGYSINIAKNSVLNFLPSASEIKSVTFISYNSNNNNNDYYTIKASDIQYTDDNIKNSVSDILRNNIESIKTKSNDNSATIRVPVKLILNNGKTAERMLYMNQKESNSLSQMMLNNTSYFNVLKNLPPNDSISNIYLLNFNDAVVNKLWNSYKMEFSSLPDAKKIEANRKNRQQPESINSDSIGAFTIFGTFDMLDYYSSFEIDSNTPQTEKLFIRESNSNFQSEYNKTIKSDEGEITHNLNITIYGRNISQNGTDVLSFDQRDSSDKTIKSIFGIIRNLPDGQINVSEPFIKIEYYGEVHTFTYFKQISAQDANEILKYKNE